MTDVAPWVANLSNLLPFFILFIVILVIVNFVTKKVKLSGFSIIIITVITGWLYYNPSVFQYMWASIATKAQEFVPSHIQSKPVETQVRKSTEYYKEQWERLLNQKLLELQQLQREQIDTELQRKQTLDFVSKYPQVPASNLLLMQQEVNNNQLLPDTYSLRCSGTTAIQLTTGTFYYQLGKETLETKLSTGLNQLLGNSIPEDIVSVCWNGCTYQPTPGLRTIEVVPAAYSNNFRLTIDSWQSTGNECTQ
jgi:hypothetical protein